MNPYRFAAGLSWGGASMRSTIVLALVVVLGSLGCSGSSDPGGSTGTSGGSTGSTGTVEGAAVTDVGAQIPGLQAAHASIDASGGTLTSLDGQLTLTVPAGALSTATTLAITPIQNTAPGGVGFAYRLEPNGTTFAQPVTLTLKPTFGQLDGATPSYDNVGAAFQDDQRRWQKLTTVTPDVANAQISLTTTHFTDYAFYLRLGLIAERYAVLGGQTESLSVTAVSDKAQANGPLIFLGDPVTVNLSATGTPTWSLNGQPQSTAGADGLLIGLGNSGGYTAPSAQPAHNPESVSVTYTADGQQITLVNNVYVLAHKYDLTVTVSESATQCVPTSSYLFHSVESASIDVDVSEALEVTGSNPGPCGAPTVSDTACCAQGCTASFNDAETCAMELTSATGTWDSTLHRLRVVAKGKNWLFPELDVTVGGSSSTVFENEMDDWNNPGYPFYLAGVRANEVAQRDTSTAVYEGYIQTSMSPKQF
jgi:hypothetical protein